MARKQKAPVHSLSAPAHQGSVSMPVLDAKPHQGYGNTGSPTAVVGAASVGTKAERCNERPTQIPKSTEEAGHIHGQFPKDLCSSHFPPLLDQGALLPL